MEAAGPAEEPVENSKIFQGLRVLPPNQMSSYASEPDTSLATSTAPADFSLEPYPLKLRIQYIIKGYQYRHDIRRMIGTLLLINPSFSVQNLIFESGRTPGGMVVWHRYYVL